MATWSSGRGPGSMGRTQRRWSAGAVSSSGSSASGSSQGTKSGIQTSSCCSKRARTRIPTRASSGVEIHEVRDQADPRIRVDGDGGDGERRHVARVPLLVVDRDAHDDARRRDVAHPEVRPTGSSDRRGPADAAARCTRCTPGTGGRRRGRPPRTAGSASSTQRESALHAIHRQPSAIAFRLLARRNIKYHILLSTERAPCSPKPRKGRPRGTRVHPVDRAERSSRSRSIDRAPATRARCRCGSRSATPSARSPPRMRARSFSPAPTATSAPEPTSSRPPAPRASRAAT